MVCPVVRERTNDDRCSHHRLRRLRAAVRSAGEPATARAQPRLRGASPWVGVDHSLCAACRSHWHGARPGGCPGGGPGRAELLQARERKRGPARPPFSPSACATPAVRRANGWSAPTTPAVSTRVMGMAVASGAWTATAAASAARTRRRVHSRRGSAAVTERDESSTSTRGLATRPSSWAPSPSSGPRGPTRSDLHRAHRGHLHAGVPDRRADPGVARPLTLDGSGHTSGRRASRSGRCARTAPASSRSRTSPSPAAGTTGPGRPSRPEARSW